MKKRVVAVIALLGLASEACPRTAHAQDGDNWFDETSAQPAPAPAAPVYAPPVAAPAAPTPVPAAAPQVPYAAPPVPAPQAPAQVDNLPETDPRAITEFRSTLDPYGTWVNDEKYGTVWLPNRDVVGPDFRPYVSAGRWALTADNDWIWQSDYPFGVVVFHYGRWVWVPNVGWAWVAGRQYANAWVTWRVPTDNYPYIGWAPMAPSWGWYGGVAVSLWWYPPSAYVFCHSHYAFAYHVHTHIIHDHHMVNDIGAHTRNYGGPGVQRTAANPRVLPPNSPSPRGPSLENARVPPSSTPTTRVPVRTAAFSPSSRAVPAVPYGSDASRRTFSNASRPLSPSTYANVRPGPTRSYRSSSYVNPSIYARHPANAPVLGGNTRTSANFPAGRSSYAIPSTQYSPSMTRYSPTRAPSYSPSFSGPSRSYSPSFHQSSSFHSAPSFRSGSSHSAPTFHGAPRR